MEAKRPGNKKADEPCTGINETKSEKGENDPEQRLTQGVNYPLTIVTAHHLLQAACNV